MQLSISTDSIYQGSICRLNASSHQQFDISPNPRILSYTKGSPSGTGVGSAEDKGKHSVEISMIGVMTETKTGYGSFGSASQYGMSYFPFVSSHFSLEISVSPGLSDIVVEVPSNFRIIWYSAKAVSPSGEPASLGTSYSEKLSTYIFSWKMPQSAGRFHIEFDVRTGGPSLLKAAYFPIYYYLIALVAVAAAGTAEHTNILLGALAGSWVFLLRHLNACDIPRRNVFLFYATLLLGVFLLIWGITWKLNRFYYNEWIVAIELLVALIAIWGGLRAVRLFESYGTLPRWLTRFWGYFVRFTEKQQSQEGDSR